MNYIKLFIIFFALSFVEVSAAPLKMEMIFLSPEKISMILEQLDRYNHMKVSQRLTQNDLSNCVPMGDGCFHPQLGYIEKENKGQAESEVKLEFKTFNATETSLVNCDPNNYFDIFCGKEAKERASAEVEIWFDVSSSLRTVDYNSNPDFCARRTFLEKVRETCKGKVNARIYNTSIKEVGESSSVCLSYGTNDQTRLLQWLNDTKAKHLLVVTDIDEMSREMRDFLDRNGAKLTGDGVKAFTSKDLIDYAKEFTKMCR